MPNKDKKNKTSIKKGEKLAEVWTEEKAIELFEGIRYNAEVDDNVLCLQDAYLKCTVYGSTFHYLIEKFPFLEKYKKDIQDIVVARVNKKALEQEYNATASIWRMKQLGEKDKQEITQDINVKNNVSTMTTEELLLRAKAAKEVE